MNSSIPVWTGAAEPPHAPKGGYNPVNMLPQDKFQLILMDQRGAGQSKGPLALNGWKTYTQDQLALLDHLGIYKCVLIGSCIGPSYQLALMEAAPERFPAAVLMQPVGLAKHTSEAEKWEGMNRQATGHWFEDWAQGCIKNKVYEEKAIRGLQDQMFSFNDFVFSVSPEFVQTIKA